MKTSVHLILSLFAAATVLAGDPFQGKDVSQATLADGVRLSARIVQDVYLMPEQITKLIFPKPVDEVSVNTQIVNIGRNPPDSKECYLLLSPKVAKGDVDMHIVMEGKTYTFRLIVGREQVNYRKTFTAEGGGPGRNLRHVPPLAPTEINTTRLIHIINQSMRDPNYASVVARTSAAAPKGSRIYGTAPRWYSRARGIITRKMSSSCRWKCITPAAGPFTSPQPRWSPTSPIPRSTIC